MRYSWMASHTGGKGLSRCHHIPPGERTRPDNSGLRGGEFWPPCSLVGPSCGPLSKCTYKYETKPELPEYSEAKGFEHNGSKQ